MYKRERESERERDRDREIEREFGGVEGTGSWGLGVLNPAWIQREPGREPVGVWRPFDRPLAGHDSWRRRRPRGTLGDGAGRPGHSSEIPRTVS